MRKRLIPIFFLLVCGFCVFPHSGRLDANGGHWDRKSGTYHYHRQVTQIPQTSPSQPQQSTPNANIDNGDTIVYVTKTGDKYHSLGCQYLKSSCIPMKLSEASLKYTPCSRCSPPILNTGQRVQNENSLKATSENAKIREEFSGKVVGITDGDTIGVLRDGREVVVRLNGIDCPELSQPFGQKAKQFTSDLCFNSDVRVAVVDTDKYGRIVANIFLSSGVCLNQQLVIYGYAWHYKEYSDDVTLSAFETAARNAKLGLWAGDNPIPPWDYRKK